MLTMAKATKKRNFADQEIEVLTTSVETRWTVLFGSLKSGVKGIHKTKIWKEVAEGVNSVSSCARTPAEICKVLADEPAKLRINALSEY